MFIVISPAKTLDYQSPLATQVATQPEFIAKSAELVKVCRDFTPADIARLMKVSDKIASLNAVRFEQWSEQATPDNARQALLAFKGDVYTGLDADSFDEQDFEFAQQHLRILSGLYGLLKPLDLMQAYRLEMGTKLATERGTNLYQFWGERITDKLKQHMTEQKSDVLINLASNEYFKAVHPNRLNVPVVTPIFKNYKNGQYKVISFWAKKARGLMARYIIQNRLTQVEQLKQFDVDGYYFVEAESNEFELVFKREP